MKHLKEYILRYVLSMYGLQTREQENCDTRIHANSSRGNIELIFFTRNVVIIQTKGRVKK